MQGQVRGVGGCPLLRCLPSSSHGVMGHSSFGWWDPDSSCPGGQEGLQIPGLIFGAKLTVCFMPHPVPPSPHSLPQKLSPLLPHQRAVLQGDRLHRAIGN